MTTRDANEGVASFVERGTPEYRGYGQKYETSGRHRRVEAVERRGRPA